MRRLVNGQKYSLGNDEESPPLLSLPREEVRGDEVVVVSLLNLLFLEGLEEYRAGADLALLRRSRLRSSFSCCDANLVLASHSLRSLDFVRSTLVDFSPRD